MARPGNDKADPERSARVGTAGFEPATPATPLQCATGLRHVPYYEERNCIPEVFRREGLLLRCTRSRGPRSCNLRVDVAASGGRPRRRLGAGDPFG